MGYRKYAKDYEIEYVDQPGKKRPKAVRIYVGPYFRFSAPPERIHFLRWFYLAGLLALALLLLILMSVDCAFSRTWYIAVPITMSWIPWLFCAAAVWRLWTAREKVDREHYDMMHDRMSGACLFLMGFCFIAVVGCILRLVDTAPVGKDYVICGGSLAAAACATALFVRRKELAMIQVDNPEKPKAGKKTQ